MIRILIADPNTASRKALKLLLSHKLGTSDIVEAADLETLIRVLTTSTCDLLLLDGQLYGVPALETCTLLQKAYPKLKIVLLSVDSDNGDIAKSAGVAFVHKGASPRSVLDVLNSLLGVPADTPPQSSSER